MIALAIAAAVASSSAQFDLVCKGFKSSYSDSDVNGSTKSEWWDERISVDLEQRVAKLASLPTSWPIVDANAAQILLRDERTSSETERWSLDRTSGQIEAKHDYSMGLHVKRSGTCSRAPFTPLPAQAF